MSRRSFAFACGALALLAGCARACKNEHPYVPYSIDEAGPGAAADDAATAAPVEDAAPPALREGVVAPADATKWTLDGIEVTAPPDRIFALGLTADVDGDGTRDAVVLLRRIGAAPGDPADLALYRGKPGGAMDAPQIVTSSPPQTLDPSCSVTQRLAQVGGKSVAVEVGAACAGHTPNAPSRWLAVATLARDAARVRFSATLLDPPGAPRMTIDVDGADRDGDGVDDVALRVTLDGGSAPFEPGPKVGATLRWFDRPAGLSRDPDEPDASLRAQAGPMAARAAKAKDAPAVPLAVHQLRALYQAMCAEGGAPRITNVLGAKAIACGSSRALEEAGLAEVRAFATMGDPLRAIAALDRAQLPPATRTSTRTADAQTWIAQASPITTATFVRAIAAVPQIDRGKAPAWGALAFESTGKLLVRTVAGVARVDAVSGDEAAAEDAQAWRSAVVSPDGASRWIEAYDPCDGFALHATFAPTGDGEPHDVPLPIAPPLGTRCATAGAKGEPAPAIPIAWGPRGLEAVVAGEPILVAPDFARATLLAVPSLDQPVTLGAPRSPNGRTTVVATSQGILVRGARARLYRARELEGGYLELRDCAVSDDAAHVACVRGGRAFVGEWGAD